MGCALDGQGSAHRPHRAAHAVPPIDRTERRGIRVLPCAAMAYTAVGVGLHCVIVGHLAATLSSGPLSLARTSLRTLDLRCGLNRIGCRNFPFS